MTLLLCQGISCDKAGGDGRTDRRVGLIPLAEGVIALFPIACSGSRKRNRDERLTSNRHE